ncbi:hypothetical protein CF319_g6019 [Tilletia indica]|nr:hypothetical protein CF319_g6019 [Tilletia indica]
MDPAEDELSTLRGQYNDILDLYKKLCRSFSAQGNLLQRKRIEIARLQGGRNRLLTSSAVGVLPLVRGPPPAPSSSGVPPPLHPAVDFQSSSPPSDPLPRADSPLDLSIDFAATGTAQPLESPDNSSFASSPCPVRSLSSTPIPRHCQNQLPSTSDTESQVVDLESQLFWQSRELVQLQHRYRQLSRSFNESLSREAVLERFVIQQRLRLSPEPPLPSSGSDTDTGSSSCQYLPSAIALPLLILLILNVPFLHAQIIHQCPDVPKSDTAAFHPWTLIPTLKTPQISKSRLLV